MVDAGTVSVVFLGTGKTMGREEDSDVDVENGEGGGRQEHPNVMEGEPEVLIAGGDPTLFVILC